MLHGQADRLVEIALPALDGIILFGRWCKELRDMFRLLCSGELGRPCFLEGFLLILFIVGPQWDGF